MDKLYHPVLSALIMTLAFFILAGALDSSDVDYFDELNTNLLRSE